MLSIIGKDLDVDGFLGATSFTPYVRNYRGEDRGDGVKLEYSRVELLVSDADFDDFKKQQTDAILFLRTHKASLSEIASTKEIEFAELRFGVDVEPDVFEKAIQFSVELLTLVAEFQLSIEVSIYPVYEED